MGMHAWHIMKEKISVGPDTKAQEVALKMISSGLPAIPVVDDTLEVLGMATEFAVLGAIRAGLDLDTITAGAMMVKTPLITDINTPLDDLVGMLLANNCCSVVALVNNNKYAGLVSRGMLMDIFTSPHYTRFSQKDRKGRFACL